jgi:hypothetical protein
MAVIDEVENLLIKFKDQGFVGWTIGIIWMIMQNSYYGQSFTKSVSNLSSQLRFEWFFLE